MDAASGFAGLAGLGSVSKDYDLEFPVSEKKDLVEKQGAVLP